MSFASLVVYLLSLMSYLQVSTVYMEYLANKLPRKQFGLVSHHEEGGGACHGEEVHGVVARHEEVHGAVACREEGGEDGHDLHRSR